MQKTVVFTLIALFMVSIAQADEYRLNTKHSSLVIRADEGTSPLFLYYGARLSDSDSPSDAGIAFNEPIYPQFGLKCLSEYALQATHFDGNTSTDLVVERVELSGDEGVSTLAVHTRDRYYKFFVTLFYKAYTESDIIETWSQISHREKRDVMLYRFCSAFLPVRRDADNYLTHFHGDWGSENYLFEEPLTGGMKVIRNKDGVRGSRTDNASFMLSLDGAPRENEGRTIGGTLSWSGNYRIMLLNDETQMTRIFAGINEDQSQYKLPAGEIFTTPPFLFTYSDEGKGGVSRNFHRWALNHRLIHGDMLRPILLNSWEGVYFDIREDVVCRMMEDFAALGGEMFVLDDGWFGEKYPRNDDSSSLGDWQVCREKLPNGIGSLVRHATKSGLKFGIWIEPEMTNFRSELYEKHPEWVVQQPHRPLVPGRADAQLVLDLSNPEVQDFVVGVVDGIMEENPEISYIKWDANMTMTTAGSTYLTADRQSHLYIDYHRGLESTFKRIRAKYPDLIMQACASGGGRLNYAFAPYFDEYWASDNTDALQRIYIQWSFSHFFPAASMASHVSANINHQTGRQIPLKMRFDVAMSARLGMELQPKDIPAEQTDFARKAIATYKDIRPVVQQGDLYRLISPYDNLNCASLMYVTPDKQRAVFFLYKMLHYERGRLPLFRMAGLERERVYRLRELNCEGEPIALDGKCFTGAMLMDSGVEIPIKTEFSSRVIELQAIE